MKKKSTRVALESKKGEKLLIYNDIHKAALVIRSVNHGLRQEILDLLAKNDKMTVTDIYVKLRIEQPVASQHLAILRRAEVVNTNRDGKKIFYSLNTSRLNDLNKFVTELLKND